MKVTRKGLKQASGFLTGAVAVVVFCGSLAVGLLVAKAILGTLACTVPLILVEQLFDLPDTLRHFRSNWRSVASMTAILVALIIGWRGYQASVGMSKAQRIQTTLALSPIAPIVALAMAVIAHHRRSRG